jgi:hypothetical protein
LTRSVWSVIECFQANGTGDESESMESESSGMRFVNRLFIAFMLIVLFSSHFPAVAQSNALPVKAKYDVRVRTDYDYRSQGSDTDQDLYEYWYGGARDLMGGRLDIYASGRSHQDLDGTPSLSLADNQYLGISDTHKNKEDRILQLYADGHDRAGRVSARVGRQYIDSSDFLHLDGAQVSFFEQARLGVGGYYGNPVSYYSSLDGDHAGGVWVTGKPWNGNRSKLTFAQYDDHNGSQDHDTFIESHQELTEYVKVNAQASILNEDFRMVRGDFYYFAPGGGTDIYCGGSRWGSFDAKTIEYSPLYNVLGKQEPATYVYARVSQRLSPYFMVTPGVSSRFAEGDAHEYANRNYNDYDVALTFEPNKKFSASVSFDYYDMSEGDSFLGLSGEIRYRQARVWEVALGTSYADYTYNSYSDISYSMNGGQTVFSQDGTVSVENPNSYTYFLRMKWKVNRRLTLRLHGDIEDNSTSSDLGYRGRASIEVRL